MFEDFRRRITLNKMFRSTSCGRNAAIRGVEAEYRGLVYSVCRHDGGVAIPETEVSQQNF